MKRLLRGLAASAEVLVAAPARAGKRLATAVPPTTDDAANLHAGNTGIYPVTDE